jgi:hypothetical protein
MAIAVVAMTVLGLWLNRPGAVAAPAATADATRP